MLGSSCFPCCGDPCQIVLPELPESIEMDITAISAPEHYASSRWIDVIGPAGSFISHGREIVRTTYAPPVSSSRVSLAKQPGATSTNATYKYVGDVVELIAQAATQSSAGGSSLNLSVNASKAGFVTGFLTRNSRNNSLRLDQWVYRIDSNCAGENSAAIGSGPRVGKMPAATISEMQSLFGSLTSTPDYTGPVPETVGSILIYNGCTPRIERVAVSGASVTTPLVCPVSASMGAVYDDWTISNSITPANTPTKYPITVSAGASALIQNTVQSPYLVYQICVNQQTITRSNPGWGDGRLARAAFGSFEPNDSLWPGYSSVPYTAGSATFGSCLPGGTQQVPYTFIRRQAGFSRNLELSNVSLLFSDGSARNIS
jgi:hypothetical protein